MEFLLSKQTQTFALTTLLWGLFEWLNTIFSLLALGTESDQEW